MITGRAVAVSAPSPQEAAGRLADFGFLASPDLPDRPGCASLLVALRARPTLRHFDPESIEYWVTDGGHGARRTLTRDTLLPLDVELSWGTIHIVDRLKVTNEYLTFGGRLSAAMVDGVLVAVFTSPAPLLRRGGHSQPWDVGAESMGAFFGRLLLAVDYAPGFEAEVAATEPVVRYAAFLTDALTRYRASLPLRSSQPDLWMVLDAAERRLRAVHPEALAAGADLLRAAHLDRV